ncbi:Hypothetical Protein FCC1311_025942 [Hondaea fermentalgiana]|uniref:Uncharacterized protein n=1 Tax=Hondaea fermentalgiana TaxID=2315210 RepID=A0A2R5GCR1_9STRA|nr:Hypothetical Protein FCC1311_025942 [Hondaea fermentalgiana]|eukprot:GBG26373.1 Hypothetical Protein FCC1311_025942 [Hondaea fermentalgiana]
MLSHLDGGRRKCVDDKPRAHSLARTIAILASLAQLTTGLDAMWKDCMGSKCYKVFGPETSYENLQSLCHGYGGELFSAGNQSVLQHVQSIFERDAQDTDGDAVLLLGALTDKEALGNLAFDDASADVTLEFIDATLETAVAKMSSGSCIQSLRLDSDSAAVSWIETACEQDRLYSVCQHTAPEYGFCYEIRWQDQKGRTRKRVMEPVTQFPQNHPKTAGNGVCGGAEYNFIPPEGLWSGKGAGKANDSSCKLVSGGELFYGYDYPTSGSSNTGFADDNALTMFFLVDSDYRGYWVLAIDKPDGVDADDGYLGMSINGSGLDGAGVNVQLKDDPAVKDVGNACEKSDLKDEGFGRDCYAWNGTHGSFIWRWHQCCTDGMVLGRLPSTDFCIDVEITKKRGLSKMLVGDFVADELDISMTEIPFDSAVNVCGYECPDFCSAITNCGECSSTKGCGWCPGYGCEAIGAKGGCAEGWRDSDSEECCEACATASSCDECVDIEGCGWNHRHHTCKSGNKYSRTLCQTSDDLENYFAFGYAECTTESPTAAVQQTNSTSAPTDAPYSATPTTSEPTTEAPTTVEPTTAEPTTAEPTTVEPTLPNTRSESTKAPAFQEETSNATTHEEAVDTPPSGPADIGPASWTIALGALGACVLLIALLAGGYKYKRRKGSRENLDGDFTSIAPGVIKQSTKVSAFQQGNPMFDNIGLVCDKPSKTYPKNPLVQALAAHKAAGDYFRVFTNNPSIAMQLSKETMCFVKCTEDDGVLLDKLEKPGPIRALVNLAMAKSSRGDASPTSKVKTHLRIKKRDEWTRHIDPATEKEFFYNGKLNEVVNDAAGINEAQASARREDADPLRWEFAPDEFEDFDLVLDVLSRANWQLCKDLHLEYFLHPESGERVWIESSTS